MSTSRQTPNPRNPVKKISGETLISILLQKHEFWGEIYIALREGYDLELAIQVGKKRSTDSMCGSIFLDQAHGYEDGVETSLYSFLDADSLNVRYQELTTAIQVPQNAQEAAAELNVTEEMAKSMIREGLRRIESNQKFSEGEKGQAELAFEKEHCKSDPGGGGRKKISHTATNLNKKTKKRI